MCTKIKKSAWKEGKGREKGKKKNKKGKTKAQRLVLFVKNAIKAIFWCKTFCYAIITGESKACEKNVSRETLYTTKLGGGAK